MRGLLISCLALLFAPFAFAQDTTQTVPPGGVAGELPTVPASPDISVTSAYQGETIDVWGVNPDRRGRGDVVIVVRGPNQPATLTRKRKFMGLWVNGPPVRFSEAPAFFAVLSSKPLDQIASRQTIWSLQLDPAVSAVLESGTPEGQGLSAADYRLALVRLRRAENLYQFGAGNFQQYQGGLFRARVSLPANAPIADYYVDSYLFRDGRMISSARFTVGVERVGIERRIHDLASKYSFLYGLLTVALALGGGWLAAYLFRRE